MLFYLSQIVHSILLEKIITKPPLFVTFLTDSLKSISLIWVRGCFLRKAGVDRPGCNGAPPPGIINVKIFSIYLEKAGGIKATVANPRYQVSIVDADYYRRVISCQNACPVHTDAQGYVNAVSGGDYRAGYVRARQPNPFASTCGRICAAHCEKACRRGKIDAPITIRALQRFLCERYGVEALKDLPAADRRQNAGAPPP